jgi:Leucine-rich repeat (LRR) protein
MLFSNAFDINRTSHSSFAFVFLLLSIEGNLIELQHLRLSQMDLDTLPPEIGFCEQIQTIDLTGNPIDNLPETLVECRQLYEFKLNYQTFHKRLDSYLLELIDDGKIRSEHVPQVVFELEHLLLLDLKHTHMNNIPNDHTLCHLQELDLSNNSFSAIPDCLSTMTQLRVLSMSSNRLKSIEQSICQLKQLHTLILSNNQLTSLTNVLARLSSLKQLFVDHNQIHTIDMGFSQCQSLLTLDLSYNDLVDLPEHISDLRQLETLDLRYNRLESLPLTIYELRNMKSMNTFHRTFQRFGLHLLGNTLSNLPAHVWKSTNIRTLFDYLEKQEKLRCHYYYHLKLIFIGPKNIGKTTLMMKLIRNRHVIEHVRQPIDMHVSTLKSQQSTSNNVNRHEQTTNDVESSVLTDQWIEQRISTSDDPCQTSMPRKKRIHPPTLATYGDQHVIESLFNQSTIITKNNIYCTMIDCTSASNFELLYPLMYDSNALFIIPVNLTVLLNTIEAATSLENIDE